MMKLLRCLLFAFCLLSHCCHSTFISVDLGADFVKVAGPKGNNIEILLNEQSNRKSSQFIGFRNGERLFGEDAKNFAPRFPDIILPAVSKLVGLSVNDTVRVVDLYRRAMFYVANIHETDAQGTVSVDFADASSPPAAASDPSSDAGSAKPRSLKYSAEELLGMFLTYVKHFSEKELEGPVRDAVITIPASFDARQRQAVIDAAALAGIRVLSLMHSNTAAALALGLQNRGFPAAINVVIFDMGSTHSEASLFTFTSPVAAPDRKVPVSEAFGSISTRRVVSDDTLGSRSFDACIAKHIEDEYVAKNPKEDPAVLRVMTAETLAKRKGLISLMRAANKAKETLSANQDLVVTVEGIATDKDFSMKLSRATFETICQPLFDKTIGLIEKLFADGGSDSIPLSDVTRFELIGGGTRVPKIVDSLRALLGKNVDRTLNSDEAIVVGAGYFGAALSGHFRIKGFSLKELLQTNTSFSLSAPQSATAGETERPVKIRPLFVSGVTSIPSRKQIALSNRTADFNFTLFSGTAVDSVTTVSGITAALHNIGFYVQQAQGLDQPAASAPDHYDNSSTSFAPGSNFSVVTTILVRLAESGLVFIEEATLTLEYFVNVSRLVAAAPEAAVVEQVAAGAADDDGAISDETPAAAPAEEPAADDSKSAESAKAKPKSSKKKKSGEKPALVRKLVLESQTRTFPLRLLNVYFTAPAPMTRSQATQSRDRLRILNAEDDARHEISSAKNDLEAYLIWCRQELPTIFPDASTLSTAGSGGSSRDLMEKRVHEVSEWLDDNGSSSSMMKEDFQEKLVSVKSLLKRLRSGGSSSNNAAPDEEKGSQAAPSSGTEEDEESQGAGADAGSAAQETDSPRESQESDSSESGGADVDTPAGGDDGQDSPDQQGDEL